MPKIPLIHAWKPKKSQNFVERDGKLLVCNFGNIFGNSEKLNEYSKFIIGKESYINRLDDIILTTNYFETYYDTDHELCTAYLKVKYCIDNTHMFTEENMNAYIDFIYEIVFNDRIVERINKMVEDNYTGDVEAVDDSKKKFLKNEKKHLESLEFKNKHVKILLAISTSMKLMAGPLFHYVQRNKIKLPKGTDIIYRFYERLFSIYGYGDNYDLFIVDEDEDDIIKDQIPPEEFENFINTHETNKVRMDNRDIRYYFTNEDGKLCYYTKCKINMYNKLYVYVKAKVLESNANNSLIFSQREIKGIDVFSVINDFTKRVIITENVVKYKFDNNIVGLAA